MADIRGSKRYRSKDCCAVSSLFNRFELLFALKQIRTGRLSATSESSGGYFHMHINKCQLNATNFEKGSQEQMTHIILSPGQDLRVFPSIKL